MKSAINPHRPRVFGDPLHPDLHEYAREHYGSIYEYMATCDFCDWQTNWLPQDYALEDANKHVLEHKEKASEVEKELIELLNLRIVQEGDYLYLTCASCLLAFTKLGGKLGQSLKDTEKGLRGIALEHLREHHLLKKKREDGKCEFEFIQDKQHGIVKTVFEGRIE